MTLPAAYAPISLGQIQSEFGGSNPAALSEYYRGNLWFFNRYYSDIYGNHFYTAIPSGEYLTQNGYVLQNSNYFLAYKNNISGTTALYRVFNDNLPSKNQHLLTTSYNEYVTLIEEPNFWNDEGIVGYVYSSSVANSQPVYRWRKNDYSDYLFTTSGGETPANYTSEGEAFYALQFGAVAYVSDNNTNVPTSGTIALSNFYSAVRAYIVTITFSRDANNQNVFYLDSDGFAQISITTSVNGGGSTNTYYIPANTIYSVTSNPDTSIRLNGSTMELDDDQSGDPDGDYNDLTITPNLGYFYESDGNFYYVLNI